MRPCQVLPLRIRMNLGAWAMKEYSATPKAPALPEPHRIVSCHIRDPCCGGLTLLQRCSRCILQPQLTGLKVTCICMPARYNSTGFNVRNLWLEFLILRLVWKKECILMLEKIAVGGWEIRRMMEKSHIPCQWTSAVSSWQHVTEDCNEAKWWP